MLKSRLWVHVIVLGIALLSGSVQAADSETAKLHAYFQEFQDKWFRQRPLEATRLGDHRFDDRLDDLSPEAQAAWNALLRQTRKELPDKVNYAKLPRAAQIDYEIWDHQLTYWLWEAEHARPLERQPREYNAYINESVYLLLAQSTLPKATNIQNAVARMAQIPHVVAAARRNLRQPPRVEVETAIRQNQGAIAFYEHGIFELAGETPPLSALGPAARQVVPVLKEYQQFLEEELLPRATNDWRLGKEAFERKLQLELNAGMSAAEVLREAEAEFARVERDMYVIARQLWSGTFPGQPLPPDDAAGRRATIARVLTQLSQDHGKAEDLVKDAQKSVEDIKAFIRDNDILRLPHPDRCRIIEMPEFQRGVSVAYLHPAPPLDPRAVSFYAISPPPRHWDRQLVTSLLEEYNHHMLHILTIHEAYPGHYVQLEYANRHPSPIRRVLFSGVFAEGWAVYTEQMMLDQGYGDGDLALRLHQLKWYLRSVANAILDHQMHCTDMSDEQALEFLTRRAFQSEAEARAKIVRAKLTSCQLSTYFVGRTAFYRLRQQVQRDMGESFQLGRFHEAVLAHGTLPVKYLPEVVKPPFPVEAPHETKKESNRDG